MEKTVNASVTYIKLHFTVFYIRYILYQISKSKFSKSKLYAY